MSNTLSRRFSVAPMMDWTDRHCRHFLRLISQHALLYTEMVTTGAILQGDRDRHLRYDQAEHPLALQLGGSDPVALAECAHIAEDYGYDEVNLNVGCPSDRVQEGRIGACLMAEPNLVAECVAAMQARVSIPVTVKHRIGIDDRDSWEDLLAFVETVASAGCNTFIVHARKAWLTGLSPKENREIPPLRYEVVYALKKQFPQLEILINGGITTWPQIDEHLLLCDGVMLGREAYHNPWILHAVDPHLFGVAPARASREAVLEALIPYVEREMAPRADGHRASQLQHISRHILGLFHGQPGGRLFRRHLSTEACKKGADAAVLRAALLTMQAE